MTRRLLPDPVPTVILRLQIDKEQRIGEQLSPRGASCIFSILNMGDSFASKVKARRLTSYATTRCLPPIFCEAVVAALHSLDYRTESVFAGKRTYRHRMPFELAQR
jgi:hypothetical protein